ncbi:MAG TPA: PIN domain-containing protein [Ktedonobacteraceae bacterium]|nr:PIN domain-containing protein [Ktedonobacteraceae bacterium]
MAWVDSLKGQVVGLDTTPLIYFIEKHPLYINIIRSFFKAVEKGECEVVTSTITLLETLVQPLRQGDKYIAAKYRTILLRTKGLKTVPVTMEIAEAAASLRAIHNIHTADSIQMATAIKWGASFFLTNDLALPSLPNLKVLTLEALKKDSETAK